MVKKLLWVLTVLSDWLEFFVEDIFHIVQSMPLYLCTFLASKIGLVAEIAICLFLDVPYHLVGLVTLLVYVQQERLVVSCCLSSSSMVVILYKMLLICFILLYSLIIGLWPVSFLCGFLLAYKYSMHCLMFESRACILVQSTRSPTSVAARSSSTISGETGRLST